ncbi:MAG: acyl-CoA thioesterase [Solirubrobacteraceae bacterium]|nr:acyl-CoA thioesterase [Solirubrobacteraceae bacterium]
MSGVGGDYVHAERIRFGHLDAMRHLNNVEFLRFFETARIEYLRTVIPDHDPADPDDFGLIFAECHINYLSPGHYNELLEVTIRPEQVKRSSFRVAFQMRVGERLLAEGWGTLVGYDYAAGRATPLPGRVREAIEQAL